VATFCKDDETTDGLRRNWGVGKMISIGRAFTESLEETVL